MNAKSVLIFDLDGTIIDSQEGITKSAQHALAKFGVEVQDPSTLVHFIGPPLLDTFMNHYGFDEQTGRAAIVEYRKYFAEHAFHQYELYDGIKELVKDLHAAGKKMLVATSKVEDIAVATLEDSGIAQYFDFIAGANEDGSRSEKAKVIEYALQNFEHTDLKEFIMIGDKQHDVRGAHKIGIPCIGVTYGFGSIDELTTAQADFIVDTVDELRSLVLE